MMENKLDIMDNAMTAPKQYRVPTLDKLLTYRRPHGSEGEKQYIIDFIMPLKPTIISDKQEPMAFFVYVGKSDIMFTSHVDTVHNRMVPDKFQKVVYKNGIYSKDDKQPLGADDAAGNWLMFNMINAQVPGIYAFFRGEERGGIGSTYCATHHAELFKDVKAAIAFDRKGKHSIITHQGRGRGCSDEFAKSLAIVIGMSHSPDNTGVYTDTAEFFHLVPNCTNVSVGYENEHSAREILDQKYIQKLCYQLIVADYDKLDHTPPVADPVFSYPIFNQRDPWDEPMPEPSYSLEWTPTELADVLFDGSKCLNIELQHEALVLAQKIYKRYE